VKKSTILFIPKGTKNQQEKLFSPTLSFLKKAFGKVLDAEGRRILDLKGSSKNVIPAPIFIGINSSRNPETVDITGLPLARQ
jgi:hypothetical protein